MIIERLEDNVFNIIFNRREVPVDAFVFVEKIIKNMLTSFNPYGPPVEIDTYWLSSGLGLQFIIVGEESPNLFNSFKRAIFSQINDDKTQVTILDSMPVST
jgi:hypothetical protein